MGWGPELRKYHKLIVTISKKKDKVIECSIGNITTYGDCPTDYYKVNRKSIIYVYYRKSIEELKTLISDIFIYQYEKL